MDLPRELVERFAGGDLEAFEALFRQFQGRVFAWVVRIVRDRGAAEDLTVETFWRIYRGRARFDPSRSFEAWARRIATNCALDYLRTRRREAPLLETPAAPAQPDRAEQAEMADRIGRAFNRLPAELRVTATLALIEEKPYVEIAEAQGISIGAVKSRVFRAVRALRKTLRRMGIEP